MRKNPFSIKKKKDNPEHRIQAEYFRILALNEAEYPSLKFIHAIPNGGLRNVIVATQMKREDVKRGVPDIFIPMCKTYKKDIVFCGCYLETKSETGTLTKEQKEFSAFLQSQNYIYKVCRSVDVLINATEIYLNITLKK